MGYTQKAKDSHLALQSEFKHSNNNVTGCKRLAYIHRFRAIAIILIVAGHSGFVFSGTGFRTPWQRIDFLFDLVTGGTALFVFVSGFLFHHCLRGEFLYVPFLKKKAVNLLLPYGVVTAATSIITISFYAAPAADAPALPLRILIDFLENFRFGLASGPLWYIPFIFGLFMFAPLFVFMARGPVIRTVLATGAFFLIGLFVNRAADTRLPFQLIAHFGPYFMIGMVCSRWRQQFEDLISTRIVAALATAAAIGLAYLQMRFGYPGMMTGAPFEPIAFDFKYLQKFALCVAICSILIRFDSRPAPALDWIADISFGIFFLHGPVIVGLAKVESRYDFLTGYAYLDLAISTAIVLGYTAATVHGIKAMTGNRSKYLIGA